MTGVTERTAREKLEAAVREHTDGCDDGAECSVCTAAIKPVMDAADVYAADEVSAAVEIALKSRLAEAEAAARAAERERIRDLAIRVRAVCTGDEGTSHYFADLLESRALGVQRYGELLRANNGRNAVGDLAEELADAVVGTLVHLLSWAAYLLDVQAGTPEVPGQ